MTNAAQDIDHILNQLQDGETRQHVLYYVLSGPHNKQLRQEVVRRLTGEIRPLAKCGINFINELLND